MKSNPLQLISRPLQEFSQVATRGLNYLRQLITRQPIRGSEQKSGSLQSENPSESLTPTKFGMAEAAAEVLAEAWYEAVGGALAQGDIFRSMQVVRPCEYADGEYNFEAKTADLIVLTQTCDIPKKGVHSLLFAEVHSYDRLTSAPGNDHLRKADYKVALERGTAVSDFLLPPTSDLLFPWSIVAFSDLWVLPKAPILGELASCRIMRMRSPYREYLSQAFARYVMRVGLPATLNGFSKR